MDVNLSVIHHERVDSSCVVATHWLTSSRRDFVGQISLITGDLKPAKILEVCICRQDVWSKKQVTLVTNFNEVSGPRPEETENSAIGRLGDGRLIF